MLGYRKVDKPLILYGDGELGKLSQGVMDRLGIPYIIVDKNGSVKPEDISNKDGLLVGVCIASEPFEPIRSQLNDMGYDDVVSVYDIFNAYPESGIENGWCVELTEDEKLKIRSLYLRWTDKESAASYRDFINWHWHRHEYRCVFTDNRYFIPEVTSVLHDHEVFVDAGAYHGEVINKFVDIVNGKFERIYAIEPDVYNLSILLKNCKQHYSRWQVSIHGVALGRDGDRSFTHGRGYMSKFGESDAPCPVMVRSLKMLNIPATFLKMHIEGAELEVLEDGLGYLRYYRPILAVTVYHNPDGLWKIEKLLIEGLGNYRFYFRNHAYQGQVGVMYCVPEERYHQ